MNSLSNIRNSVRDAKVSCIKALDEYKDAINIRDIINNQEKFLDFDLTYNQLRDKQKEKLTENLQTFQELNKGISIVVQNLINDVCNNINDLLVKTLDNSQYEEIAQKINLKKVKPVNKDDIVNQINEKIIKMKINKNRKKTMNNPTILDNILLEENENNVQNNKLRNRNTIIPQNHETLNKILDDYENKNNFYTFKDNNSTNNNRSLNDTNGNTNLNNLTSSFDNNGALTNFQTDNKNQISNLTSSPSQFHIGNSNQSINKSCDKMGRGISPFAYNNENITKNSFETNMDKEKNNSKSNPFIDFINKEDTPFLKVTKNGQDNAGNNNFNTQNPKRNIFDSVFYKNFINNDGENDYFNSIRDKNNNNKTMNNSIHESNSYNDDENNNVNNSNISNNYNLNNKANQDDGEMDINLEHVKKEKENPFSSSNAINDSNSQKNEMRFPFTNINSSNLNYNNNNNYNDDNKDSSLDTNSNKNQLHSSHLLQLAKNCKIILEEANESGSEMNTQKGKNLSIEYYLNKPFILRPIPNTTKIKIVTEEESEENIITLNFPNNLSISSFLYNCSYCNHKKSYIYLEE